jgi:hypothetical protein
LGWREQSDRAITIRCVGFGDDEITILREYLKTVDEVEQVAIPLNESVHDVEKDLLYVVISAGALLGRKVFEKGVDILTDRIKQWFVGREVGEGAEVEIYGANGEVIKRVKRDGKTEK